MLMAINVQVNMTTRKMTRLFFIYLFIFSFSPWTLTVGIFHFCISRPSKFSLFGFLLCIIFWSVKYTCMSKMKFPSLLRQISFFYIQFANDWNITCFIPNLILVWPQSQGLNLMQAADFTLQHILNDWF